MPSGDDGYFDPRMVRRQTLFWTVATRIQLRRWEVAFAKTLRPQFRGEQAEGAVIWEEQREQHLTFVAARNLVYALDKLDGQEVQIDHGLEVMHWGRDLLEHWDENMPVFNRSPRPRDPGYWTGKKFAERYPDQSPYSFAWNGSEGPKLIPSLSAADLHAVLDEIEAQVIEADPNLARFVQQPLPSPWGGDWYPVPESTDPA